MGNEKNIIITGITGQDGIFLTEKLLQKEQNYKIFGFTRNTNDKTFYFNLKYLNKKIGIENVTLLDSKYLKNKKLSELINDIEPKYIFNMSGPSSVYESIKNPKLANEIKTIFSNLIRSCVINQQFPGIFQASSSEMFGKNNQKILNENSLFNPTSPYAIAKYEVHQEILELRKKYDWNIVSGIMFNHESEFRKNDYLFMKIINFAILAKGNKQKQKLKLGSLDLKRDWSYAGDIANAAILTLENKSMCDYVLGSGSLSSIRDIVSIVFSYFSLDWEHYVEIDNSILRFSDPIERVADPSKIKSELGWEAKKDVGEIIKKIIDFKLI